MTDHEHTESVDEQVQLPEDGIADLAPDAIEQSNVAGGVPPEPTQEKKIAAGLFGIPPGPSN